MAHLALNCSQMKCEHLLNGLTFKDIYKKILEVYNLDFTLKLEQY